MRNQETIPERLGGIFLSDYERRCRSMNILKLELKKTNIKPYFLSAIAVFVCIMGLTYILAWVPHLDSGDKNAAILFSTYQGIAAICNAIALMSFSILASAMGYRYLTKEYCGVGAILLFSYPINRKSVVWAKAAVILPVSYTHLDVYKRQIIPCSFRPP